MFTHLHVHTEYSMLDGLSRLEPLVYRTKELGMDSLAITDHGRMYGAIDFYRIAKTAGIKPIIGCEMYVAPSSRFDKNPQESSPYHITVLAKDAKGYGNLVKLVTKADLEGFYYKPRVDRQLLEEYHQGLIVLSGCPSGEIPKLLSGGKYDEARNTAIWYREVFEDYYFELMDHKGVPHLPIINKGLIRLHDELDIPYVATNDSHYVNKEDASLQDILICIHTNSNINDENRLRMEDDSYYLKSPEEMLGLYPELPAAVTNSYQIAEKCDLHLDFSQARLPQFKVPDDVDSNHYLATLCWKGLDTRFERVGAEEKERLRYELKVIEQTNFADYFLVAWDIGRFASKKGILSAVRGSAASSLVLYCLGVTQINPVPYRLVFERFLNAERREMPDIDFDFQDDRREEVINYVVSRYGEEHVAQIITFGTLGARASTRDVGRALDMPYRDVDVIARVIPERLHITLEESLEESSELRRLYDSDENTRRLVDTARRMEGITRHSSTHAAGIVISKEPLEDIIPLQRPAKTNGSGIIMTQFAMEPVAALGLLKMDFLGLSNLSVLDRTIKTIHKHKGILVSLKGIPLDDTRTFDLLSAGETVGVFQLEGPGMVHHIKDLKPSSISDVAAMIALYRPGPMDHIRTFIDAKHGRAEVQYLHPALEEILEETYGVIVYQDQVLHIAQTFAGYTLGEADIVRKAMGKKIPEIMSQEKEKFLEGAKRAGYSQELARRVFDLVEPFAGYAFNKAHSVSYGLISYWTAYLKANYALEYMVSYLNSFMGNMRKTVSAVTECQRLGIEVLPPDINYSQCDFTIGSSEDSVTSIRFGLGAVKNVGAEALMPLIDSRGSAGHFTSLEQMCRVGNMGKLNRKTLESIIKVGTLDSFGDRGALLSSVDRILSVAKNEAKLRDSNQTTMFDLFGDTVPTPLASISLPDVDTSESEKRLWETELIGVVVSGSAQNNLPLLATGNGTVVLASQLNVNMVGNRVILIGQVSTITDRWTREDRPFKIINLELRDGPVNVFVWENVLKKTKGLWESARVVRVSGIIRVRGEAISISCDEAAMYLDEHEKLGTGEKIGIDEDLNLPDHRLSVEPWERTAEQESGHGNNGELALLNGQSSGGERKHLSLLIRESNSIGKDQKLLDDVKRLLLHYGGTDEILLEIITGSQIVTLDWPLLKVDACNDLEQRLSSLLGTSGEAIVRNVSR